MRAVKSQFLSNFNGNTLLVKRAVPQVLIRGKINIVHKREMIKVGGISSVKPCANAHTRLIVGLITN